MPTRKASATWHGTLKEGNGTVSTESSALNEVPYSFSSRFENGKGTNPEELIGAAHAGCFTLATSHALAQAGYPPTRAHSDARVHLEKGDGGFEITRVDLVLEAEVPGVSEDQFQQIAREAKENCIVSKVLSAAEITLEATLKSS